MGLEAYQSYWSAIGYRGDRRRSRMAQIRESAGIQSGFGSAGDPIGAQTPMVQDSMFQQLARRASGENGRIDDWESLVDPTITYGSNLRKILQKGGKAIDSAIEEDRKNWFESAVDRQQAHAKEKIRSNLQALESGDSADLRRDIAAEFGDAFVDGAIAEAKALEAPAGDVGAPEPAAEPEPATADGPALSDPINRPEQVKTTEPEQATAEPTAGPKPATADRRDYSGILGLGRLVIDAITANYRQGKRESMDSAAQTTEQRTLGGY